VLLLQDIASHLLTNHPIGPLQLLATQPKDSVTPTFTDAGVQLGQRFQAPVQGSVTQIKIRYVRVQSIIIQQQSWGGAPAKYYVRVRLMNSLLLATNLEWH
jgi:hypothetical protein